MTITPVKPTPPRYINRPRPLRGQPKTPDVGTYPMPDPTRGKNCVKCPKCKQVQEVENV